MKHSLTMLTLVLATSFQGSSVQSLDQLRDQARPLLLFAPNAADPRLLEQANLFAAFTPGLRERQVKIYVVTDGIARLPAGDPSVWKPPLADAPETLRRRFALTSGDFAVILIGKDGGEKLRSNAPLTYATLRDIIDAMPMRQQETRPPH